MSRSAKWRGFLCVVTLLIGLCGVVMIGQAAISSAVPRGGSAHAVTIVDITAARSAAPTRLTMQRLDEGARPPHNGCVGRDAHTVWQGGAARAWMPCRSRCAATLACGAPATADSSCMSRLIRTVSIGSRIATVSVSRT